IEAEAFYPGQRPWTEVRGQVQQRAGDLDRPALAAAVPAVIPPLQPLAAAVERYRPFVTASGATVSAQGLKALGATVSALGRQALPVVFLQHWQEEDRAVDDPDLEERLRL